MAIADDKQVFVEDFIRVKRELLSVYDDFIQNPSPDYLNPGSDDESVDSPDMAEKESLFKKAHIDLRKRVGKQLEHYEDRPMRFYNVLSKHSGVAGRALINVLRLKVFVKSPRDNPYARALHSFFVAATQVLGDKPLVPMDPEERLRAAKAAATGSYNDTLITQRSLRAGNITQLRLK